MNPPRRAYETRAEYLTCERVNEGAPSHVVDTMVCEIIEGRRVGSIMWNEAQHVWALVNIRGRGYPVS